jgi:hypothetical protein
VQRLWVTAPMVMFAGLFACNEVDTNNFTVQTPPASCVPQSDVTGCGSEEMGFACTGTQAPDDGDNELVCKSGSPGPQGTTLYCCLAFSQTSTDCWADDSVSGCAGAYGFSCTGGVAGVGGVSPDQADPFLACHELTTSATATTYCCIDATTPASCAADSMLACSGSSVGYSCAGSSTPDSLDASIVCSVSTTSVTGGAGYCCVAYPQSPDGCQKNVDMKGCPSDSYGFSCADGVTPEAAQPSLECIKSPPAEDGQTPYCCTL